MTKILIFVLVDGSIADMYIFPVLYCCQVFPAFIMFPGTLSNSSEYLNLRIPLMPTCMMAAS